MYAVIKTGGKQYRVQPGDVLVVEKLEGDAGAKVSFDQVLLVGGDDGVTVGAPVVEGAVVHATLVETRRGEKIKVFKKIRRQGYRRTKGHRQSETVLRVTGLEAGGKTEKWSGKVDLTPLAELTARARGLALRSAVPAEAHVEAVVEPAPKAAKTKGKPVEVEATVVETNIPETEAAAPAPAPKKPRAKKAAPPAAEGGEA